MKFQTRPLGADAMQLSAPLILNPGTPFEVAGAAGDFLLQFEDGSLAILPSPLFDMLFQVATSDDWSADLHVQPMGGFGATILDGTHTLRAGQEAVAAMAARAEDEAGGEGKRSPPVVRTASGTRQIPADAFPWPRSDGHYSDDGPATPKGVPYDFEIDGLRLRVTFEGEGGFNTGKRRYRTECLSCSTILHPATTNPADAIRAHAASGCWRQTTDGAWTNQP